MPKKTSITHKIVKIAQAKKEMKKSGASTEGLASDGSDDLIKKLNVPTETESVSPTKSNGTGPTNEVLDDSPQKRPAVASNEPIILIDNDDSFIVSYPKMSVTWNNHLSHQDGIRHCASSFGRLLC